MRERLAGWLATALRHPQYKALSFLLASTLWFYVQSNEPAEAGIRVEIRWTLPEGLMTVDPLPPHAAAIVSGTRSATRWAHDVEDIYVSVDLSAFQAGDHAVELRGLGVTGLPAGVAVTGWSPPSVPFTLDEVATRKVKVRAVQIGEPLQGYAVSELRLEPAVVELRGPRSRLVRLEEVATRPIDVTGFDGLRDVAVRLDLPRSIAPTTDVQPRALVKVEPTIETTSFHSVPVYVWQQPDWRPSVEEVAVTVRGPRAAVLALTPRDVAVFAHLPDDPQRARYETPFGPSEGPRLRVLVAGASGVEVLKVEPASIEVVHR